MLDPIKVTITMPGMDVTGTFAERGIPAQIVTMFLDEQRIEIEKTGDYMLLVLFSIGMTRGKWGTLLDGLLGFKRAYDENTPLSVALPRLIAAQPERYARPRAGRPMRRDARRPARRAHAGTRSTAPSTRCPTRSSHPPTPTGASFAVAASACRSPRWPSARRP